MKCETAREIGIELCAEEPVTRQLFKNYMKTALEPIAQRKGECFLLLIGEEECLVFFDSERHEPLIRLVLVPYSESKSYDFVCQTSSGSSVVVVLKDAGERRVSYSTFEALKRSILYFEIDGNIGADIFVDYLREKVFGVSTGFEERLREIECRGDDELMKIATEIAKKVETRSREVFTTTHNQGALNTICSAYKELCRICNPEIGDSSIYGLFTDVRMLEIFYELKTESLREKLIQMERNHSRITGLQRKCVEAAKTFLSVE